MGEGLWTCETAVRYKGIMDRDGKCFLATRRTKKTTHIKHMFAIRNVWRYQRGNHNPKKDTKQNGQKKKDKKTQTKIHKTTNRKPKIK